jgi:hypothetical protein
MIAVKEISWMEFFLRIELIFNKVAVLTAEGRLLYQIN